ncbi:hypothetical protein, partial [Streptomyces diastaticus]|uniref:hypothetical protein n=1 Tax=Streptomyces diastaticus TaxID=1956 RepID=UPI0036689E1B
MTKLYYRFVYWRRRLGRSVRPAAEPRRPAPARRRLAVESGAYRFLPLYMFVVISWAFLAPSLLL